MRMCGKQLFSTGSTMDALSGYFGLVSKTGYAKPASVKLILLRLFIQDLLAYAKDYVSDEDYAMFGEVLHNTESGDCLLPYSVYCTNRTAYNINGEDGNDYAGPIV